MLEIVWRQYPSLFKKIFNRFLTWSETIYYHQYSQINLVTMKLFGRLILLTVVLSNNLALATSDRYRLTLRDNPSTTIVIGWEQVSGSNPVVYYGTTDYGTDWAAYPSSLSPSQTVRYKGMNNHFARITGLQPNTAYYFVINDSQETSSRFWFKTVPDNPNERLSFIAGGDSRNNRTPRQNANKLVSKLKPHAVLFGGDMTDDDSDSQWQGWFDDWQLTIAGDGRMFPILAARGNHEESNSSIYNLFDVPSTEAYYALTFGGSLVRAYTLNTETSISGSQTDWLVSDLQSASTTWKMAQYHKPMRPHVSSKREGNNQYYYWAKPFYDHSVNLVFESDAHTVKTTWPIRPSTSSGSDEGFIRDDVTGTVYVGEGCWGAPLRSNNDTKPWTRSSDQFNQFKWVFIDQDKMEVRTIKVDNASSVGEVSNSNQFAIPANLDIWNPSNGSVVTIVDGGSVPLCDILSPFNGQYYDKPQTISIAANVFDADGSIVGVEFFVDGIALETDTSSPYSINYSIPAEGSYIITAEATDNDNIKNRSDVVNINVGEVSQSISIRTMEDAEEESDGTMDASSSDIELVTDGSKGNQVVGLRFHKVEVPVGATITNANIQFTVDETDTGVASLTIKGHDTDNASSFSSTAHNLSGRSTTSASVKWNPPSWSDVGAAAADQRSPDIKAIVQEIVDRDGWSQGNSLVIIITGTGTRTAEAYDGESSSAALLNIDYSIVVEEEQILDLEDFEDISIYPNPIGESVTILLPEVEADVMIFNVEGKMVIKESSRPVRSKIIMDTKDLDSGIYILTIKTDKEYFTKKVIKE